MISASSEIRSLHRSHRRRVAIPAIGILVALTAAGGLLLTTSSSDVAAATSPAVHATVNIGQPLVVSRDDTPSDARANIGDAVVVRADEPRS